MLGTYIAQICLLYFSLFSLKRLTHRKDKIFLESCLLKPNLDWNHTFPIEIAPNKISFNQSIGKVKSKFG